MSSETSRKIVYSRVRSFLFCSNCDSLHHGTPIFSPLADNVRGCDKCVNVWMICLDDFTWWIVVEKSETSVQARQCFCNNLFQFMFSATERSTTTTIDMSWKSQKSPSLFLETQYNGPYVFRIRFNYFSAFSTLKIWKFQLWKAVNRDFLHMPCCIYVVFYNLFLTISHYTWSYLQCLDDFIRWIVAMQCCCNNLFQLIFSAAESSTITTIELSWISLI